MANVKDDSERSDGEETVDLTLLIKARRTLERDDLSVAKLRKYPVNVLIALCEERSLPLPSRVLQPGHNAKRVKLTLIGLLLVCLPVQLFEASH